MLYKQEESGCDVVAYSKYHYYQKSDSIMHSAINARMMRSYAVVRDTVLEIILNTPSYRFWHEYFLCNLLFTYILSVTKTEVEKESYGKWVAELRKNFSVFNKNEHLSTKQKMTMIFCAIAPHVFYGVRRLIKRNG